MTTTAIGGVVRVVLSLPAPLRAAVVIAGVLIGGVIAYQNVRVVPANDPLRVAAAYAHGGLADPNHPGADMHNPQNVEAAHKAEEDATAVRWHFDHEAEDHPPEVPIDANRQIFYRYYASTDHCLYLRRRDGDSDRTQWVRDPNFHKHDVDKKERKASQPLNPVQNGIGSPVATLLARSIASIETVASAATRSEVAEGGQPNCVNPHQGQFRYWWGTPIDQCLSPMYRQFPDGCTHYQLYNRCANAWDSKINWTTCVAQHNR